MVQKHAETKGIKKQRMHLLGASVLALSVFSVSTVSIAQFEVDLNGRIDFIAKKEQPFTDVVTVTGATSTTPITSAGSPTAVFADDAAFAQALSATGGSVSTERSRQSADFDLDSLGRLDVNVSNQTATLDYGSFVRVELDADAQTLSDIEGHVFVGNEWGKLRLGTDIDGFQRAFDTSQISVGPLYPGKTVSFGGELDGAKENEASIVYQSPALLGFRLDAEVDDKSDWGASLSYRGTLGEGDVELVLGGEADDAIGGYAKGNYGDFTLLGFYMQDDDQESASGGGVAYHVGPLSLSLDASIARTNELVGLSVDGISGVTSATVNSSAEREETDVVLGASYKVAPGLDVSGSVGMIENDRSGDAVNARGRLRIKF